MFLGSENAMLESERVCDYESEWDGYCMSESQSTGGRAQGVRLQWHQKLRRNMAIRIDMKCATASGTQRNSHTIVHSHTKSPHTLRRDLIESKRTTALPTATSTSSRNASRSSLLRSADSITTHGSGQAVSLVHHQQSRPTTEPRAVHLRGRETPENCRTPGLPPSAAPLDDPRTTSNWIRCAIGRRRP